MSSSRLLPIPEHRSRGDEDINVADAAHAEDEEHSNVSNTHCLGRRKRLQRPEMYTGTASDEIARHDEAEAATSDVGTQGDSVEQNLRHIPQDSVREVLKIIRHVLMYASPPDLKKEYLPELFTGPAERARTARLIAGLQHVQWSTGADDLASDGDHEQTLHSVSEGIQKCASHATNLVELSKEKEGSLFGKIFQRIDLEDRSAGTEKLACIRKLVGEVRTSMHTQSEKNMQMQNLAREIKLEQNSTYTTLKSICEELDQLVDDLTPPAPAPIMHRAEKRALAAEFARYLDTVQKYGLSIASDLDACLADVEMAAKGISQREDIQADMGTLRERVEELIQDYEDEKAMD